jgi:cytochrome c oxidase assembly protein subunit 15
MSDRPAQQRSPWPHRLAVALALVTFPLIWVGGLVTTYDAGMAVPDWPGTYGYNLFAYPWTTWIAGPWDLFIEHGHRLLGASAGLVAIALVVVTWRADSRRWLRMAALGALALVIFQGVLGGARVLLDARLVALLHGCVGPLFFAYLAALVIATSRWWQSVSLDSTENTHLVRATWITVALAYGQLVLGAIVRHVPLVASPQVFRLALLFHLVAAAALIVQMMLVAVQAYRADAKHSGLRTPAIALPLLLLVQIALGIGTYVAKYSWPAWLGNYQFAAAFVIQERSLGQALVTTAHVANGSLILFVSVVLAVRATRIFGLVRPRMTAFSVRGTECSVLNTQYTLATSARDIADPPRRTQEAA